MFPAHLAQVVQEANSIARIHSDEDDVLLARRRIGGHDHHRWGQGVQERREACGILPLVRSHASRGGAPGTCDEKLELGGGLGLLSFKTFFSPPKLLLLKPPLAP